MLVQVHRPDEQRVGLLGGVVPVAVEVGVEQRGVSDHVSVLISWSICAAAGPSVTSTWSSRLQYATTDAPGCGGTTDPPVPWDRSAEPGVPSWNSNRTRWWAPRKV